MKIERYDNRETAPHALHRVLLVIEMVIGVLMTVLALCFSMMMFNEDFMNALNAAALSVVGNETGGMMLLILCAFLFVVGAVFVVSSVAGKHYKPLFIFGLAMRLVLVILLNMLQLINVTTVMDAFSSVLSIATCIFLSLYYYQRLPLFASDYDLKHQPVQNSENKEEEKIDE